MYKSELTENQLLKFVDICSILNSNKYTDLRFFKILHSTYQPIILDNQNKQPLTIIKYNDEHYVIITTTSLYKKKITICIKL